MRSRTLERNIVSPTSVRLRELRSTCGSAGERLLTTSGATRYRGSGFWGKTTSKPYTVGSCCKQLRHPLFHENMASFRAAAFRASSLLRTPVTTRQTPLVKPVLAQRPSTSIFLSRNYASDAASSGVEAPDYLDERERKIFDTIKGELHPTKLEVGRKQTALSTLLGALKLRSLSGV